MTPRQVDELSFRECAVLMVGARLRRLDAWLLNARLCAMLENCTRAVGKMLGGDDAKTASVSDYLPAFFQPSAPTIDREPTAAERWAQALAQDAASRKRRGLEPIDWSKR